MVPMLDLALELAAEDGAHEVVTGMAHRGRLNVLAHIVGRPYEVILREFEGERNLAAISNQPAGASGDVKYHLGAEGERKTAAGDITVTLAANPRATSRQSTRSSRASHEANRRTARRPAATTTRESRSQS